MGNAKILILSLCTCALLVSALASCSSSRDRRDDTPVYQPGYDPYIPSNGADHDDDDGDDDDDDDRRSGGECRTVERRMRECIDDIHNAETELEEVEEYLRCVDRVEDHTEDCYDEIEEEIEDRCDEDSDEEAAFDCVIAQGLLFTCLARAEESDDDPEDVARRYTYCYDNLRDVTIECSPCD